MGRDYWRCWMVVETATSLYLEGTTPTTVYEKERNNRDTRMKDGAPLQICMTLEDSLILQSMDSTE